MGCADRPRRARARATSPGLQVATSGRPGPVVLALPEDMLRDGSTPRTRTVSRRSPAHPGAERPRRAAPAARRRRAADRAGRRRRLDRQAAARHRAFAEANELPVGGSFRRQDYVDNALARLRGDVGIGPDPKLATRVSDADLLLVVGARLGEITTQRLHADRRPRPPRQTLMHVHPAAEELGRVYQPALAIVRARREFAAAARRSSRSTPTRLARLDGRGARGLRGEPAARDRARARLPDLGRSWRGCASGCPTTRSSPTAPAISRLGAPLLQYRRSGTQLAPTAARWATACRRRSRRSSSTRSASSSASPATAAS